MWQAYAAAAGIQILAAHEQARMIEANAEFQSKISELNRQLAEVDAAEATRQGFAEQARYSSEITQVEAQQEAILASQGLKAGDDSLGDLIKQSQLNAALNKQDIGRAAEMTASKFRREARQIGLQDQVNRVNASNQAQATRISGYASAVSTGASGFGKAGG